jgi:hypothetical protein
MGYFILARMKLTLCAARDCRQPFEPAFGQEETQKYCSAPCGNRERIRRCRERKRAGGDNGGGPGGKPQPRLFPAAAMNRRKPAKAVVKPKPKQDGLFPEDGIHATQAIGYEYDRNGELSGVLVIGRKSRKSSPRVSSTSEAPLAA